MVTISEVMFILFIIMVGFYAGRYYEEERKEMNTATLIKDNLAKFRGHAALYELSPAYNYSHWGEDSTSCNQVVVSAVSDYLVNEVMAFPACEGEQSSWTDLAVIRNESSHAKLLASMGYELRSEGND